MKKPPKTPGAHAFFSRSKSEKFDYFLKGSQSLYMNHLRDIKREENDYVQHPLYHIFQILKKSNIEVDNDYSWGMDYERTEIRSYFLDGGLFCASGGNFYESKGVWLKGKKAMEFLRDELNLIQQSGQVIAMPLKDKI